jgi:hypothetical protein
VTSQPAERARISALDILERLEGLEFRGLDPLQRVLLITDGTLTEILEATLLEPISLVKLAQDFIPAAESDANLEPEQNEIFRSATTIVRRLNGNDRIGDRAPYAKAARLFDMMNAAMASMLSKLSTPVSCAWTSMP